MVLIAPSPPHPRPAFDAVIWDYDGTLVATRSADESAVDTLLRQNASAAEGTAIFWATEGKPIEERIDRAWPGQLEQILPLFANNVKPVPFRGVISVLDGLHRRGYALAVVSSRRRRTLEWGLDATGLRRRFEVLIGLDDVDEPKPSPEGLLKALHGLCVPPTRAVYVGDSEVDMLAGRRAGMTAWRATWARGVERNDTNARLLERPREVLALVEPEVERD